MGPRARPDRASSPPTALVPDLGSHAHELAAVFGQTRLERRADRQPVADGRLTAFATPWAWQHLEDVRALCRACGDVELETLVEQGVFAPVGVAAAAFLALDPAVLRSAFCAVQVSPLGAGAAACLAPEEEREEDADEPDEK